ncbi:hypothetical protein [Litoribrevibacter albus]|uniref:Lipoprotein n=1 Tax=Litoribrevibacter albus TaxID=1473156 RepID=A0AA37W602_9GAMM|nr:hypothetical protein [Litoribrevibacter albus]GLQ31602.1 hypothetical protein GCM10007876_20810 [Litoribrevibacter albus]
MASPFSLKKNKKIVSLFSILSALTLLSGCDSGSGDSIGPKPDITLSGEVIKGTVIGAPVNVYRASQSSGTIPSTPNVEGIEDNLYTDLSGKFSVILDGDDFRNRTIVVQVGVAKCSSSSSEYDEDNNGCRDTDGTYVSIDDFYYVGQYRCDDPISGCIHPETGDVVDFGELLPIDFELRSVVPLLSNSSSVRSQTANVSALTTLAASEILNVGGGYSENVALAIYDKIAKVFQLDGIDFLTHDLVDVSNLSSNVTNDSTWLLSSVNAAIVTTASRPETGVATTLGRGFASLTSVYLSNGGQMVYRYSGADDQDLQSIFSLAQSITSDSQVSGFVSDSAKNTLTEIQTDINNQPANTLTEETVSQDILDLIASDVADAKSYLFDFMDWYSDEVAPSTPAYSKFEFMMESVKAGASESLGYMETLGNDFTLVLSAALAQIQNTSWDGSDLTLTSQDSDGNDVEAVLSKSGSRYTVEGQFLNTTFDFTFTYRETTNEDGVMPDNPPEGEEDDRVYRFDIEDDGAGVQFAAFNKGLTLNFEEDVAVSIQVDSVFTGLESSVVRSSFAWGDIKLAQIENAPRYSTDLGRISIEGQLVFSMEHVADTITRFNDTYTDTEEFTVPRVDDRAFVFLQFGIYSLTNPSPSKFRLTVSGQGNNVGDTWPVSFLYAVLNQENVQGELYGAEGFGSFDPNYLENVWGENDCDFLPVTYSILFNQNTSDDYDFNDIEVTLPSSGGARDLVYSMTLTKQRSELSSTTKNEKDDARLCSVTYTNGSVTADVDFYKTSSSSETGSYMGRSFNYIGFGELSNNHSLLFAESAGTEDNLSSRSSLMSYDDCENLGSYGGGAGRLYSCNTPAAGSDDEFCFNSGLYADLNATPIIGSKIERQLNGETGNYELVVTDENYRSCSDGEDWEVRYTDGTIQVLPVDLSLFGTPAN